MKNGWICSKTSGLYSFVYSFLAVTSITIGPHIESIPDIFIGNVTGLFIVIVYPFLFETKVFENKLWDIVMAYRFGIHKDLPPLDRILEKTLVFDHYSGNCAVLQGCSLFYLVSGTLVPWGSDFCLGRMKRRRRNNPLRSILKEKDKWKGERGRVSGLYRPVFCSAIRPQDQFLLCIITKYFGTFCHKLAIPDKKQK